MHEDVVADRYAKSLFKVLEDPIVISQLEVIVQMFEGRHGISDFFDKETIDHGERERWVEREFHSFLAPVRKLVEVLDEKKRIDLLEKIHLEYKRLIYDKNEMERIYIKTATKASKESIKEIVTFFEQKFDRALRPVVIVDPKIVGGVSVQVMGRLYDDTIQTKLDKVVYDLKKR